MERESLEPDILRWIFNERKAVEEYPFDPDVDASDDEITLFLALLQKRCPEKRLPSRELAKKVLEEVKARSWLKQVGMSPKECKSG